MSKSNICGMSLIMSAVITLCTLLHLNSIGNAYASVSGVDFFESTIALIRGFLPDLITYFVLATLALTVIKLFNTALCCKLISSVTSIADIVVFVLCYVICNIHFSLLSWFALLASTLNLVFVAVLSRAEM